MTTETRRFVLPSVNGLVEWLFQNGNSGNNAVGDLTIYLYVPKIAVRI
jgi:hypothetical protein